MATRNGNPDVRPAEVLRRASGYLDRHGIESPDATAEILLMHVLGTDRAGLYARASGLDTREARMFGRAICQRCAGTPVQHLTGDQPFRGITLEVRPGVFVPRPETELLVGHALAELGGREAPVVVDAGTGTGAIALAVKDERPDATVFATDLSAEAVELARANAGRLGLAVTVLEGDLLEPLPLVLRGRVDVVVSNPPYVPAEDVEDLPAEVRADPVLSLAGGIDVYERLGTQASGWLRGGGVLAVEIDARLGDPVVRALSSAFAEVRVEPDLAGRDRVVLARAP
jgi:release factor glutamine methyltransferase